jgi:hypothetical protein
MEECNICQKSFASRKTLLYHQRNIHNVRKYNKSIRRNNSEAEEVRVVGQGDFECTECEGICRLFQTQVELNYHIANQHGDYYICFFGIFFFLILQINV